MKETSNDALFLKCWGEVLFSFFFLFFFLNLSSSTADNVLPVQIEPAIVPMAFQNCSQISSFRYFCICAFWLNMNIYININIYVCEACVCMVMDVQSPYQIMILQI